MTKRQKKKYLKKHGIFNHDSWMCTLDDLYIVGPELRNKIACGTKMERIEKCIKRYDYYSAYYNNDNKELKQKLWDIEWNPYGFHFPQRSFYIPPPPRKQTDENAANAEEDDIPIEQIWKATQEVEDMAYHPSLKKELTTESMCVILKVLKEITSRSFRREYAMKNGEKMTTFEYYEDFKIGEK